MTDSTASSGIQSAGGDLYSEFWKLGWENLKTTLALDSGSEPLQRFVICPSHKVSTLETPRRHRLRVRVEPQRTPVELSPQGLLGVAAAFRARAVLGPLQRAAREPAVLLALRGIGRRHGDHARHDTALREERGDLPAQDARRPVRAARRHLTPAVLRYVVSRLV